MHETNSEMPQSFSFRSLNKTATVTYAAIRPISKHNWKSWRGSKTCFALTAWRTHFLSANLQLICRHLGKAWRVCLILNLWSLRPDCPNLQIEVLIALCVSDCSPFPWGGCTPPSCVLLHWFAIEGFFAFLFRSYNGLRRKISSEKKNRLLIFVNLGNRSMC